MISATCLPPMPNSTTSKIGSRPRVEFVADYADSYQPRGAARQLFANKDREVLLAGPAGTGKSRACLEKLHLAALQRPIRAAIIRKTRASLTQSALVTYRTKVLPQPSGVAFHDTDQEFRYPSGARVVIRGLDDPEKVGSTEFDLVYVQEATELDENDWGMLLRGLRNNVLSYQQIMADCNPAFPQHWLKQRCDVGECTLLESRHEDNPLLFSDDGQATPFGTTYLQTLDSLHGYQYQRLRLGLWVAAEGMFFTEWDPAKHALEAFDIPKSWPRWVSVDWGYAVPFCALWHTRDPVTRQVYTYREIYAAEIREEQQAQRIRELSADERVLLHILDPAMFNPRTESKRPSIAQVYWTAARLRNLYPGMNQRIQGWSIMRRNLAVDPAQPETPPRWRIFRRQCPNLLRELPTLVHDPLDPEDVADVVGGKKVDDHAADAARYGLAAEAQPPLPAKLKARWG